MRRLSDPVLRVALPVIATGGAILAFALAGGGLSAFREPGFLALLALAVAGECVELRIARQHDDIRVTASSLFSFAALMLYGILPAAIAFALSAVALDAYRRAVPLKMAFNAAVSAISIAAGGVVLELLTSLPRTGASPPFAMEELPAILLAGVAVLVFNNGLAGAVSALAMGARVARALADDIRMILFIDGVLLAFAPVVVLAIDHSPWLTVLLAPPFMAVWHSSREAERRRHEALHDSLTGIPNRVLFQSRLEQELERARHTGAKVTVMVTDLDGFKEVNDTLGHRQGDLLLKLIAERLSACFDGDDLVARLSGDEFGVLQVGASGRQALAAGEKIRAAVDEPARVGGLEIRAGASVGVAWSPNHAVDAEALLRCADVAMYNAKRDRTGVEAYNEARDPYSPERLVLGAELRDGIERGELVLHYQPKIDIATGAVQGVEALVRWRHPQRGLLSPAEFIDLAERSDLIGPLTLEVLNQALAQSREWRALGIDLPVAVNMPAQALLDGALPSSLARMLEDLDLPRGALQLEITEGSLIHDPQRSADILERLRFAGVGVSIDDFGTGYSSLAWLRRFPVDEIKIDRSFVAEMDQNPSDVAIVRSTIQLGHLLGLVVVAEGVETDATLSRLAAFGCDLAQGYLVSRPLPADELLRWLASWHDGAPAREEARARAVASGA